MAMKRRNLILLAVATHLLLTTIHGLIHLAIPIFLSGWIIAFSIGSLYILPLIGAGLVVTNYPRIGGTVLITAGIITLVFEGIFHFLLPNPDHIAHVSDHRVWFGTTGTLTTLGNLLLVGAGWFSARDT